MKILAILAIWMLVLMPTAPLFALEADAITDVPAISSSSIASSVDEPDLKAIEKSKNISGLRVVGNANVSVRIAALTREKKRIATATGLTAEQKSSLTAEVQSSIDGLNAISAKLKAANDAATIQALIKSIYQDYRVFAIGIPKVDGELANYRQIASLAKLTTYWSTLNSLASDWQAKSVDVAQIETSLASVKAETDAVAGFYATSLKGFQMLTPASYPAKDALVVANKSFADGNAQLRKARTDLTKVASAMRKLEKTMKIDMKKVSTLNSARSAESAVVPSSTSTSASVSAAFVAPVPVTTPTANVAVNASVMVALDAKGFVPAVMSVKSGTTVSFINVGSQLMWVSGDTTTRKTYSDFDEGIAVNNGGEYRYTFTKAGQWIYYNRSNPLISGMIIVK